MLHAVTFMWVNPRNDGEVPIATTDATDGFPRLVMIWSNPYAPCMEYLPTFALKIAQM